MSRSKDLLAVVEAARGLGAIPPREKRWTHLPLCVLDAVYSIGAQYGGTARTVHDYARAEDLTHVLEPAGQVAVGAFAATELSVSRLRDRIDEEGPVAFARLIGNRQRTSPRGGVLKAEAAGEYARVLSAHGVEYLADVTTLLTEPDRLAAVEADLARVPGHGWHGVRVAYLWMLAGDDDHVKPDRMVVGWLTKALGRAPSVPEAAALVEEAAKQLGVTPWELDHAIWNLQRSGRIRRKDTAAPTGNTVAMSARDEAEQLLPDPSVTEQLAEAVGLSRTDFVETFGASWTLAKEHGTDLDADPSGSGNLFGPWYLAGHPIQLMMRPREHDQVELAVPVGRGSGSGDTHAWLPAAERTTLPAGPELLRTAPTVVADFLKRRRASFRYCRYCRALTPPEGRLESDVCYDCGGVWRGLMY